MTLGKVLRLGKIFRKDGRTLIVAMDHAVSGPVKGLERPSETIAKVIAGKPDAIMTNLGIIRSFARELSELPSVILSIPADMTAIRYVREAPRLGVDAVKISIFGPLGGAEKYAIFGPVSVACERYGIPLIAEPAPMTQEGRLMHDVETVKKIARMGAEMGADFVKVAYTGSSETFREVVRTCPVPVTIMGGPKMDTAKEVLTSVKGMVEAGGAGVAFGRNVWQHENPKAMVTAIRKILHEDASVEDALRELE
jgi:fructose-bisphosphate aldolase/2-amino-3,7-dideoxy-D-threo-hept-6-ulosonate synthase